MTKDLDVSGLRLQSSILVANDFGRLPVIQKLDASLVVCRIVSVVAFSAAFWYGFGCLSLDSQDRVVYLLSLHCFHNRDHAHIHDHNHLHKPASSKGVGQEARIR